MRCHPVNVSAIKGNFAKVVVLACRIASKGGYSRVRVILSEIVPVVGKAFRVLYLIHSSNEPNRLERTFAEMLVPVVPSARTTYWSTLVDRRSRQISRLLYLISMAVFDSPPN
jgi:hypothetical protein